MRDGAISFTVESHFSKSYVIGSDFEKCDNIGILIFVEYHLNIFVFFFFIIKKILVTNVGNNLSTLEGNWMNILIIYLLLMILTFHS